MLHSFLHILVVDENLRAWKFGFKWEIVEQVWRLFVDQQCLRAAQPLCLLAVWWREKGVGGWFPSSSNFYSFFAVWKKFLILVAIDFCEFGVHGLWIMPFTEPSGTDGVGIWILKLQYFLQPNIGEGVGCKLLSICYAVYFGHNAKLSKLPNLFSYWKYKYYD